MVQSPTNSPPYRSYVYIVGWSRAGPIKIGRTNALLKRLTQLQIGVPYRLRIWGAARVNDAAKAESLCHRHLRAAALLGEWFSIAPKSARQILAEIAASIDPRWNWWQPSLSEAMYRAHQLNPSSPRPSSVHKRYRKDAAMAELRWQRKQGWR